MQGNSHHRSVFAGSAGLGLALALLLAAPGLAQRHKPAPPPAQKPATAVQPCPLTLSDEGTHRLIMKDGNYQTFSKCEVAGERVRYMSAERYEWEEVPKSLVDWEASAKYEQAVQAGKVPGEAARTASDEENDRRAREAPAPEVASGVHLPDASGVFLLDAFQGKPELVELSQNGGEINQERGRNVLRAALNPFAGSKQSIELKGARAQVQAHTLQPVFYLKLDPADTAVSGSEDSQAGATAQAAPALADRYRIARLSRKKDSRIIGNLKVAFTGKLSQHQELVPSRAEFFSPPWVKLTPLQSLEPGEYAVVEMLGEKEINLYVWDFGMDPDAPESPFVWREAPAPESGKDEPPALTNRPKK